MPVSERNNNRVMAQDQMSTSMAQTILAEETRAFGNKAAKLSLQTATAAFVHAKQAQHQPDDTKQEQK